MSVSIHPLRRWLFEHQETLEHFGDRARISKGHLSSIMNNQKRPTLNVIDKITRATKGAITANDFQRGKQVREVIAALNGGGG